MAKETELAWAAGFFDGEGHIGCVNGPRRNGLTIRVGQRDQFVLDRFLEAVGVGNIYVGDKLGRPFYTYAISSKLGIIQVKEALWPWLSPIKRKQFQDCFNKKDW